MFDFKYVSTKWYWLVILVVVWLCMLALSAIIAAAAQKKQLRQEFKFATRDLTMGGVCIAIAVALMFVAVFEMPQGGSVTIFSTVPIIIYCYFFGFSKGIVVTSAFMILQLLDGPYIISPYSALLDYVIPYSALAVTGIFAYNPKKGNTLRSHTGIFIGCAIYLLVRFTSHFLSGVLIFGPPEGYTAVGWSLLYNSFFLVDFGIAMTGIIALLSSKNFNNYMRSQIVNAPKINKTEN